MTRLNTRLWIACVIICILASLHSSMGHDHHTAVTSDAQAPSTKPSEVYAQVEVLQPSDSETGSHKLPSMGYSANNDNGIAVVTHSSLTRKPTRKSPLLPQKRTIRAPPPAEIASIVLAFAQAVQEAQRRELELALEQLTPENPGHITIVAEGLGEDIQAIIDAKSKETGLLYRVRKQTHPGADGAHTHFIISSDFMVPHGDHFHRASDAARHADYLILILFILFVGSFAAISVWKRTHPASYDLAVLLGLWLMPAYVAFMAQFYRFLFIWSIFSAVSLRLVYKATRRPLAGSTPRQIYSWFMHTYNLAYYVALLGAIVIALPLFGFNMQFETTDVPQPATPSINQPSQAEIEQLPRTRSLAYYGFLLLFYGLYFGVLGRDTASVCVTWLAKTMGCATSIVHEQSFDASNTDSAASTAALLAGDPQSQPQPQTQAASAFKLTAKKGICALCGDRLRAASQQPNPVHSQATLDERRRRAGLGSGMKNLSRDDNDGEESEADADQSLIVKKSQFGEDDEDIDVELAERGSSAATIKPVADPRDEKTYKLPCDHVFHEFCLRGWLLVGKRDTCPSCHESCSAREHFNRSPREIQSIVWSQLLDYLRFVLVVNPLLFLMSKFALQVLY